jgi:hypothetical protein
MQSVEHVVSKVPSVAAVEEEPDRFERLAGGVRDGGHRDRPGGFGLFVERAGEAPRFVLRGGNVLGVHGCFSLVGAALMTST